MIRPKTFWTLAALTAVMVVAAVVSVNMQRALTTIPTDRAPAFPKLAEAINRVAEIAIVSNKAKFTIVRSDKSWGLKEKGGYEVSFEKVKSAIVGISNLKLFEAKTNDPKRYDRLQVEDPGSEDAGSVGVELRDGEGTVLAAGIIGKRHFDLFGSGGGGTYLRKGKEARSWLAEGEVKLGAEPNDWMILDIVNIEAEDIRRAFIRQPDKTEIAIAKKDRKDKRFSVSGVPPGRKLKDEDEGKNLAGGLWRLSFEDVKRQAEMTFPDKHHVAEYETFDGLKVRVEITMIEDVAWGRFSASAEGATGAEAEAVRTKAAELNARTAGWVYELSPGEGEKLTTKIGDIVEKPKGS